MIAISAQQNFVQIRDQTHEIFRTLARVFHGKRVTPAPKPNAEREREDDRCECGGPPWHGEASAERRGTYWRDRFDSEL